MASSKTLQHGKCFARFWFTHFYSHIRSKTKHTRSLWSLVHFQILLNSWIKTVRSHFPWSNLYIGALFTMSINCDVNVCLFLAVCPLCNTVEPMNSKETSSSFNCYSQTLFPCNRGTLKVLETSKEPIDIYSCYYSWAHGTAVLVTKYAKARLLGQHFSGEQAPHVKNSRKLKM